MKRPRLRHKQEGECCPAMAEPAACRAASAARQLTAARTAPLVMGAALDHADLLVLYIDGQRFGTHLISAVGAWIARANRFGFVCSVSPPNQTTSRRVGILHQLGPDGYAYRPQQRQGLSPVSGGRGQWSLKWS